MSTCAMAVWIKGSIKVSIKGSYNWLSDDRSYHSSALSITKHVKKNESLYQHFQGLYLGQLVQVFELCLELLGLVEVFQLG